MLIRVSHETKLAFSAPTRGLHLGLRLMPRSFESQLVLRWRVGVDLDASLKRREDPFGSIVQSLSWHKPIESLTVTAHGEAQTTDAIGVLRGAVDPLPPSIFLRASPLAQANAALRDFAAKAGGDDPLDRLHRLMEATHEALAFSKGFGGEAPASEVVALKRGGAADFAHVFIACARAGGVPARLVTGYFVEDEPDEAQEMFAWAEAHVAGLGWIGFDAVHNECPNDRYVRVASGLDAREAAPVRVWTNGAETEITARLRVEQAASQNQN